MHIISSEDILWAFERQLHEDWGNQIDDIAIALYELPYTFLVATPQGEILIYSPSFQEEGVLWKSRTYDEFCAEGH